MGNFKRAVAFIQTSNKKEDKVRTRMCKKNLVCVIIFYLTVCACLKANAQTDTSVVFNDEQRKKNVFSIGLGVQRGFIFAHSEDVQNTKGANPTGIEGFFSWQKVDTAIWRLCNCFPRRGLFLAYYNYDTHILGQSATAAFFLEPSYKLGKKTFFSFIGAAGVSYLSNPFDSIKNFENRSYSTHISAYLRLGMGIWYQVAPHWWLNTSVNYQHESNGGLRQPNKGINWPTAGITISHQKFSPDYISGRRTKNKFWKDYHPRWDVAFFATARRSSNLRGESTHLPVYGLSVNVSKQIGRINMLTFGAEAARDEELYVKSKRDSLGISPVNVALLAGHEFILGKFLFSQRIGLYLFDEAPDHDLLYHRWGIQYSISKNFGVALTLKAHRHVADYADLRLIYSLQKKPGGIE